MPSQALGVLRPLLDFAKKELAAGNKSLALQQAEACRELAGSTAVLSQRYGEEQPDQVDHFQQTKARALLLAAEAARCVLLDDASALAGYEGAAAAYVVGNAPLLASAAYREAAACVGAADDAAREKRRALLTKRRELVASLGALEPGQEVCPRCMPAGDGMRRASRKALCPEHTAAVLADIDAYLLAPTLASFSSSDPAAEEQQPKENLETQPGEAAVESSAAPHAAPAP
jgi:hypothetical protein